MSKINKSFVSDIDQFLTEYDKKHKKSASQQAELDKYEALGKLRDRIMKAKQITKSELWEGF